MSDISPQWELFDFVAKRELNFERETTADLAESRADTERRIAYGIAYLLTYFGERTRKSVNMNPGKGMQVFKTYEILEVPQDTLPKTHEKNVIVEQIAHGKNGPITEYGSAVLRLIDVDGSEDLHITVRDPFSGYSALVTDEAGDQLGFEALEELADAVDTMIIEAHHETAPNGTPYAPIEYPAPYMEPEFIEAVRSYGDV